MGRLTLDLLEEGQDPPQVGDLIISARLVRIITDVRPVESRVWHDRWQLELRTLGPRHPYPAEAVAAAVPEGAKVIEVGPYYRRGEGPADRSRERVCPSGRARTTALKLLPRDSGHFLGLPSTSTGGEGLRGMRWR